MSDYVPTTDQVRRYWQYGGNAWADGLAHDDDTLADGTSFGAEFDRWLAEVIREARREGYREGFLDGNSFVEGSGDLADAMNPYGADDEKEQQ